METQWVCHEPRSPLIARFLNLLGFASAYRTSTDQITRFQVAQSNCHLECLECAGDTMTSVCMPTASFLSDGRMGSNSRKHDYCKSQPFAIGLFQMFTIDQNQTGGILRS